MSQQQIARLRQLMSEMQDEYGARMEDVWAQLLRWSEANGVALDGPEMVEECFWRR